MKMITYHVAGRVATITLDRAEKRNALNNAMVKELHTAFDDAEKDENVKVIVLKANGSSFCAGADLGYLQEMQQYTTQENEEDSKQLANLYKKIYTHSKVVIAAINGSAIAGGCGLVTVCDFAYSLPDAKYGYTEVKIGFVPAIVMVFLSQKIGTAKAKQLLLQGNIIDAKAALQLGLITEIVETQEQLISTVNDLAQQLCTQNASSSMQMVKKIFAETLGFSLDQTLDYAANMNANARQSVDCKKGIQSFLNKEKLNW
jgi:methylglutaconyl-CoA hydratase